MTQNPVLLLTSDPMCSVDRQVWAGVELGAAIVVVAAGPADTDLTAVASAATTSLFTGSASNNKPLPAVLQRRRERGEFTNGDQSHDSGRELAKKVADGEDQHGNASPTTTADPRNSLSVGLEHPAEEPCPPLAVVVGHQDSRRILEWIRDAPRGGGGGGEGGGGGYRVTARLTERGEVGRLWGDVAWASDSGNWPAGVYTRACADVG